MHACLLASTQWIVFMHISTVHAVRYTHTCMHIQHSMQARMQAWDADISRAYTSSLPLSSFSTSKAMGCGSSAFHKINIIWGHNGLWWCTEKKLSRKYILQPWPFCESSHIVIFRFYLSEVVSIIRRTPFNLQVVKIIEGYIEWRLVTCLINLSRSSINP